MKVIMISGKARHGKDTLASYMKKDLEKNNHKVCIMHFSNYIKYLLYYYFGWDGNEDNKPRSLMQELGTDVIREKMKKEMFFIDRTIEDIEILSNYYDIFIISDVRLPKEFEYIKNKFPDTIKININRINFVNELSSDEKKHVTETALDNYDEYDYKVINTTLEKLEEDAIKIVQEVIYNA